jgi:acetyltransferase-like isoleucine patch superfamily enzyme
VKIWSANHIFRKDAPVNKSDYEYKKVILGKNVWVGANAFIMPGCELGEGSVVSAGSVVGGKKYPPFSVLAGNPARMIKKVT